MGKFTEWNKNWCFRFLQKHPLDKRNINLVYEEAVAGYLKPGMVIYDAGGGKHCKYIKHIDKESMYIFALDSSKEELLFNYSVDGKFITDVCDSIPTPYGEVDMITSSFTCEYLFNPWKYYKNAYKALKPYGLFINLFQCRFGIAAIIKRFISGKIPKKVIEKLSGERVFEDDNEAYYENLWYAKVKDDYKKAGFRIEKIYLRYLQCDAYYYFIPLFLMGYVWDWCMKKLRLKNMCSHMMIVARKI